MAPSVVPYRVLLIILMSIFACRVLAQYLLQFTSSDMLPAFEHWHSETMSYAVLLAVQLVILGAMCAIIFLVPFRNPTPRLGAGLLWFGWIYVAIMTLRLIVGALNLSDHSWFDGAVSTAFHFGLAAFVLVLGSALKGAWRERAPPETDVARTLARYGAYPALLCGSYLFFLWLRDTGSPVLFSSYLSVLVGGMGVLMHETFSPFRNAWRPHIPDALNDSVFLALVQVALPALLKAGALALVISLPTLSPPSLRGLWPHESPLLVQIALMFLIAEFFRYWLHRALHEVQWLWPLHAVHHASQKLYTVNVGRFHPLDKSIQFLGDAAPFILLGVSPEIFAGYFVLYGITGFYQHSNADVRIGPLNWILAGPELHRWHHDADPIDCRCNYGNTLIVWDMVFGTRLLPRDRAVGEIGIGNRLWPNGFAAQMLAPFTTSTEQTGG